MRHKRLFPWRALAGAAVLALSVCTAGTGARAEAGTGEAAVTINGQDHSLAEFNYYFNSWYASFTEDNSAYLPYMFDESRSLKEQEYEEGVSWFDYFVEQAALSMQQILTLSDEARSMGVTLGKADRTKIDDVLDALSSFADALGMDTEEYLANFYGEGMDLQLFTECLTDARLADACSGVIRQSAAFTQEEIEAFYRENIKDYTTVSYERYFARASSMTEVPSPEEMAEAEKLAGLIYGQVEAGTSLKEAAAPYADQGAYYTFDDAEYLTGSVYGDWLFDNARKDGDVYRVKDVNGWYVMVFHGRREADYPAAEILDAFFAPDTSLESAEEQMEKSCLEAEAFLQRWKDGGADRDAFEELAQAQAEESGRPFAYAPVARGTFDDALDRWIFDEARTGGDCEVLYAPEGFHVLYYAGTLVPAWQVLVTEDLQENAYREWFDGLMETSELIRHDQVLEHAGGY